MDEIGEEAPLGVAATSMLPPRPADTDPNRKSLLYRVLLSKYVPPQERIHPPTGMVAPNPEGAW